MILQLKKKIINFFDSFLQEYDSKFDRSLSDEIAGLESRIRYLEQENIDISNALYEVENRLQSQIDKINPQVMDLKDFTLGE